MTKDTVEVYRDRKKEWRWRRIAMNGRKVSNSGEGYQRPGYCMKRARDRNRDVRRFVKIPID